MADPKERPILFSGPMVRAILAGQKTVTRRVAKDFSGSALAHANAAIRCPYGAPGDRLWVRETWQAMEIDGVKLCAYRASCPNDTFDFDGPQGIRGIEVKRWRPGIHMPRTFSRLSLDVVDVRVERLHTIDDADADTLAIIDTWRICHVWEWLDLWAPQVTYGDWPGTRLLAMAYGGRDGDEAAEIAARTGCIECPLTKEDRAMLALLRIAKYRYYAPLRELRQLWEWLRSPLVRLRKRGGETRKDGTLAENQNRMGPATIEARREALARVLDIQRRVNEGAAACGGKPICLLDAEEIACIERMHAEGRYPQKWSDADPRATELFDQHYSDGTVQPLLAGLEVRR